MQNIIAIYARKSRFTGKGESIGNQVEECKEYLNETIFQLPCGWYVQYV